MASVEYKNAMSALRREASKNLQASPPRSPPFYAQSSEKEVLRKMPATLKSLGPIGKSLGKSGMKIGLGLQKKIALKPIGADSKKSKGSGLPKVQQQVAMDGVPRTKSFNAGRIMPEYIWSDEEESDEEKSSLAEIPDLPAESSSLDDKDKPEILKKKHGDTEPKEDLPSPGTPKKPVNLFTRKFMGMFDGMVSASNETKHGESPSSTQGGPQTSKPGGSGMSGQIPVPGSRGAQGSTAGGAGGDDPDDPRRPTPRKLPEDKGDEDLEQKKLRAAKKALVNKMMGHTDTLLQNAFHSAAAPLGTKNPAQGSSLKPLDAHPREVKESTSQEESSQTGEEGNVEVLQKKVVSLNKEVKMMQNLVDCCRKDYEELQSSFNDYSKDFLEVDETRASIRMLKDENAIFKSTQAKASKDSLVSKEKIMKYKNTISKMQVDIDFLNAEKVELYKKVKLQRNASQASSAEPKQQASKPDQESTSMALPRTSSSLQALDHLKLEEENRVLKQQIEQFEASLAAHKKESMVFKEKLAKKTQNEEELKFKNNNLAAENALLSTKCNKLTKQCDQFSVSEALTPTGTPKANENIEVNKLKDELDELKETLHDETARVETLGYMISCANNENEKLQNQIDELENELSEVQDQHKKTVSYKDRELTILKQNIDAKDETSKSLKKQIRQFETSFEKKMAKQSEEDEELRSRIKNLAAENTLLCAKRKETTVCDMSETLDELRNILEAVSSAKHQLANDSNDNVQLQGRTSSPLSVELAEAEEGLSPQTKPEVNQRNELHTLSHSITAMTEELVDEIIIIKTKLAKAHSDNVDPIPKADGNIEEMKKLKDELDELTETLKDETARCESFECMVSCTNQQNEQLREEVYELEAELSKTQNELRNTVSYKDRELANLKRNIVGRDQKYDEVAVELTKIFDENDALKAVIASFNNSTRKVATKEVNLQECIDELESENGKLLDKLSAERKEIHKLQRELHNGQQNSPREDNTHLKNALQSKIDSLIEILDNIDNNDLSDSRIRQHPCMVTMHKGMQVLGDITGLVKTLGKACGASSEKCPTLNKESRVEELEQMVENLREEKRKLLEENQRLGQQKKEKKVRFSEDTIRGENSMNLDELRNALQKATQALDDRNAQTTELEDEMAVLKAENDYLESLVADIRAQTIDDKKDCQDEMTKCQEKIKLLQNDLEKKTANEKCLKEQLSKVENEQNQLLLERQALEKKLEVSIQDVKEEGGDTTASVTATADRIKKLEEIKDELMEKIEVYEGFFDELKEEKEENYKDFERASTEIMLLKKHSDEHIDELERRLNDKEMFETQLNSTIKVLEKKCSKLEEEKMESEKQIEAMAKSINVESKLEKCKKEWKDLELKLQDKILTLDTETANAQQQLHSQKHELLQVSESFECRTKELAECLTERNALLEELASLKDKHSEQKEDLKVYMDSLTMDRVKMEEAIREKEKEVKLARQSSFETINDLEKRLKERQDSELELQEKVRALGEQVIQATAEKLKADQKIKELAESTHENEVAENNMTPKTEEERKLQDKLNKLEVTISKLTKEKQEAETLARHEVLLRDDSEETNYKIIRSLEDRISELKAGSAGIEDNTKAMLEAMNAKKNLEELVKKKTLAEKELNKKLESMKTRLSNVIAAKKKIANDVGTLKYDNILGTAKLKTKIENLEKELAENSERATALNDRIQRLESKIENTGKALKERESELELVKKSYEDKIQTPRDALENKEKEFGFSKKSLAEDSQRATELKDRIQRLETEIENSVKALKEKESEVELAKKSYEDKIKVSRDALEEKEKELRLTKKSFEQKIQKSRDILEDKEKEFGLAKKSFESLADSSERATELKDRIQRLETEIEISRNALKERESEVGLVKKKYEDKIEKSEKALTEKEKDFELVKKSYEDKIRNSKIALKEKKREFDMAKKYYEEKIKTSRLNALQENGSEVELVKKTYEQKIQKSQDALEEKESEFNMAKKYYEDKIQTSRDALEGKQKDFDLAKKNYEQTIKKSQDDLEEKESQFKFSKKSYEQKIKKSQDALKEKESQFALAKESYEQKIQKSRDALEDKENQFELAKKSYEQKIQKSRDALKEREGQFALAKESYEEKIQTSRDALMGKENRLQLTKKNYDAKIEDLKKKLTSQLDSEHEIRKKMDLLKQKISSLEAEKLQHNKTISSMIKSLQTKEELSQAIKARNIVDKELKDQLKDMEVIVNKMRKEKTKPNYDQELKAKYKAEYYESRDKVRKLSEDMKKYEEQVEKLKKTRKVAAERNEEEYESEIEESSDDLSSLEETGVKHINLQGRLTTLQDKIAGLEKEKSAGEKTIKSLLRSTREKEKLEKYLEAKREADMKLIQQLDDAMEAVKMLRFAKRQVERELESSQEKMEAAKNESNLVEQQSSERISDLQECLKKRYLSQKDMKTKLKSLVNKLKLLETDNAKADKKIKTMLETLKSKDDLEQCIKEKDKTEKLLKGKVIELQLGKKDAETESRKYQLQSQDETRNSKELSKKLLSEIDELKKRLLMTEEQNKSYESKLDKYMVLAQKNREERKDLRENMAVLRNQLSDEKENRIAEKTRLEQRFENEMENKTKQEIILSDRVAAYKTELEEKKAQIVNLKAEMEIQNSGIEKLKAENSLMADRTCIQVKELSVKITEHVARENNLVEQFESLMVTANKVNNDKQQLLLEVEELKSDSITSVRSSRKQVEELAKHESDHLEKIDELMLMIKTLEAENRRSEMVHQDFQSEVSKMTQNSRDAIVKLTADLKIETENNKNLKATLSEMTARVDHLAESNTKHATKNEEYEKKCRAQKHYLNKFQREIKKYKECEKSLKQQSEAMKVNLSVTEERKRENDAEHKRQTRGLVCESKQATVKVEELQQHIKQRMQWEQQLKSDIELLQNKVSEMNLTVDDEKAEKHDLLKLYSQSKDRIIELEEKIENTMEDSEKLRVQVVRLHEEKQNLARNMDDNCKLMMEQRNLEIQSLESKLSQRDEKISSCISRNIEMQRFQDQLMMVAQREEFEIKMEKEQELQRKAAKAIMESWEDSERRIDNFRANWQYLDHLKAQPTITDRPSAHKPPMAFDSTGSELDHVSRTTSVFEKTTSGSINVGRPSEYKPTRPTSAFAQATSGSVNTSSTYRPTSTFERAPHRIAWSHLNSSYDRTYKPELYSFANQL